MNIAVEILRNKKLSDVEKIECLINLGLDLEDIFDLAMKEE